MSRAKDVYLVIDWGAGWEEPVAVFSSKGAAMACAIKRLVGIGERVARGEPLDFLGARYVPERGEHGQ